jgi:hypothetical protein
MTAFYDEIEIEDFKFDEEKQIYTYPCPCGDKFLISLVCFNLYIYMPKCPLQFAATFSIWDFLDEVKKTCL